MRRLASHSAFLTILLTLAGCGGSRGLPAGAPLMKPSTGGTASARITPVAPFKPQVVSQGTRDGQFLTREGGESPAFSPRGDRLAFTTPSRGVIVAKPDGTETQNLNGSRPGDHDPTWTSSGDAVVVVRAGARGGSAIVKISIVDARVTTLYEANSALRQPKMLKNGGLVFIAEQGESVLTRLDGQGAKPVMLWKGPLAGSPTVHPSGNYVVFEQGGASVGLMRVPLNGGRAEAMGVQGGRPRGPVFSPSGNSLAYIADEGVFIAQADGSHTSRVLLGNSFEQICWQPGASRLVVAVTDNGHTNLKSTDLPSR